MARALTVEQVAEYLQLSPYTVREWIRQGKLPGRKIGRVYRILDTELETLVGGSPESQATASARSKPRRSARGILAGGSWTVEDFLRDKRADIEWEDRRLNR